MGKRGFIVYHDYAKHFQRLSDEELGKLMRAVMLYEAGGDEPDLEGAVGMAFSFMQANLDRDKAAWEAKAKASQANGVKGGRPRKNEAPEQPKETDENPVGFSETERSPEEPTKPKNVTVTGTVTATDIVKSNAGNESGGSRRTSKPTSRFVPPTIEEVAAYCKARGNDVQAERFVDFYTAKDWMIGKNKMRDWKASVRTWEHHTPSAREPCLAPTGSGNVFADLAREMREEFDST